MTRARSGDTRGMVELSPSGVAFWLVVPVLLPVGHPVQVVQPLR